eukprot:TRINITY_DN42078_c0_g1_i1.p1 TRINITY_DN42078_c0_g1~~TRINITY_DN42078_c0_g1_i1.p1  ORF type:complete len:157 (+),score=15.13 TRINITY_DN42078_c0_g1_i1:774-1244(+)
MCGMLPAIEPKYFVIPVSSLRVICPKSFQPIWESIKSRIRMARAFYGETLSRLRQHLFVSVAQNIGLENRIVGKIQALEVCLERRIPPNVHQSLCKLGRCLCDEVKQDRVHPGRSMMEEFSGLRAQTMKEGMTTANMPYTWIASPGNIPFFSAQAT